MTTRRVLLLNGSLYGGGAEHIIATLARHLRVAGHAVTVGVIAKGRELPAQLVSEGFDVVSRIGLADSDRRLGIWRTANALKRLITQRAIDIVHTHDLQSLSVAGLCRLRGRFGHVHTFHFGNYPLTGWKARMLEGAFARIPDQLVAVGHVQCEAVADALKIPPERIAVVWNGVDPPAELCTSREESVRAIPVVGSISSFIEQKGLPTLLEAVRDVRESGLSFKLVLVGEGPLRAQLEATATRLGLDDVVEFRGWMPEGRRLLPDVDIFVQSSYWEAMSVVTLEAMAARRAILATSVGENTAVLRHEISAILVPPRDAPRLAEGLKRLLRDPRLRRDLGDAAFDAYLARFTATAMTQQYAQIYERTLATVSSHKNLAVSDMRPNAES